MFTPVLIRCGMILPFLPPMMGTHGPNGVRPEFGQISRASAVADQRILERPDSPTDSPEIREIAELRKGLRMSPLNGSVLEAIPIAMDAATGGSPAKEGELESEFQQILGSIMRTSAAEHSIVASDQARPPSMSPPDRVPDFLREISRQLDQLANDREELQDYDTADQLRELSHRLRQKARTLR